MSGDLKILDGYINFACKMYSKSGQGDDKNFIISPLNLSLGLSLLLAGAKKSCESEMKHLLDYVHTSTADIHKSNAKLYELIKSFTSIVDFKFQNRLYLSDGTEICSQFADLVKNSYKAGEIKHLNFSDAEASAAAINEWVDSVLKVKFSKPVVPALISGGFRMVLVNALYFKGNWFKKFDKTLTKRADFHLMDGSVQQVTMMQLNNRKFKFKSSAAGLSASICEFPFIGEGLSMSIILPNKDASLAVVESELTAETIKDALEEYNFAVKVNVRIPQFRIEESSEFANLFRDLDAPHVFSGFRVDFSGIGANAQNHYVNRVFNKLVVEVDEEGGDVPLSKTGIGATKWATPSAIGSGTEVFNCDRPFMFIIHDHEYRLPLIMGKYTKP